MKTKLSRSRLARSGQMFRRFQIHVNCAACLLGVGLSFTVTPGLAQSNGKQPLSKPEVVKMLDRHTPQGEIKRLVRERHIDFQVTAEVEKDLRANHGASDEVVGVLKEFQLQSGTTQIPNSPSTPSSSSLETDETILGKDFTGAMVLQASAVCDLPHVEYVNNVVSNPDGTLLATSGTVWPDLSIRIWNSSTCEQVAQMVGHKNYISDLTFSPDGSLIASASTDFTARVWDVASRSQLRTISHSRWATSVSFSADAKLVGSGGYVDAKVWSVRTGQVIRTFKNTIDAVFAFSADGRLFAASGGKDTTETDNVSVFEVGTGRLVFQLTFQPVNEARKPFFDPKGNYLVVRANSLYLFSLKDGQLLRKLRIEGQNSDGFWSNVQTVFFHPFPLWISTDGHYIRAWNFETMKPSFIVQTEPGVLGVAIVERKLLFWNRTKNGGIRLWRADLSGVLH